MSAFIEQASSTARRAIQAKRWPQVKACAREILDRKRDSAEGYFLLGLAEAAVSRQEQALRAFTRSIDLDVGRYDAAVELAGLYMRMNAFGKAVELVTIHVAQMNNSPLYLDKAGTIYVNAGLPEKAWPLYQRALELQPDVDTLQANFAACSVYVGKISEARTLYRELLERDPEHRRNHYEYSRLSTASDSSHVEQMKDLLQASDSAPEENIFTYYALGKECEDLQRWDEAFDYFERAGDAALSVSNYDVTADIELIDTVIDVCSDAWMADRPTGGSGDESARTPVFIVGLPRTGTTLLERILSSHSRVESIGETYFVQTALKQVSRITSADAMTPAIVRAAAKKDIRRIAAAYLDSIAYKLGDKELFIEKFPENFLYLGFIAKAFPNARIIHVQRNPMDACFALFKQSYFRYAYSLDDLGQYYVAYHRLHEHWRGILKDRLIEIDYEAIVREQEAQTRGILGKLGLEFESACLNFENNSDASNTASTVQIREKTHSRSVGRWMRFTSQLQPLQSFLESAGIDVA